MTVTQQSIAGFEHRRRHLLELACRGTSNIDHRGREIHRAVDFSGISAIAKLHLGRDIETANRRLCRVAEWFDRPLHPEMESRGHDGPCTFVAMRLCRAWFLFKDSDLLAKRTRELIRRFFLEFDLHSRHNSENHHMLFHTSRYLMAREMPGEIFKGYDCRGEDLIGKDAEWLKTFIRYRSRRGWGEWDSACYFQVDWNCLLNLHDYAADKELQSLAAMMLDLMLADMAVDSINGMYCGAHGRIYDPHALNHSTENTRTHQYLYFGNLPDNAVTWPRPVQIDPLVSSYRPRRIVLDIALDRSRPYDNRERKHLHNVQDVLPVKPLDGSIRKITRYTPHYVLGAVQFQDPYPPGLKAGWYARHSQHEWDLSFGTRPGARLFTHHPNGAGATSHSYWTGDSRCGCVSTFQHNTALLALYDIPADQPKQFIHAYVPHDSLDAVIEEEGWIFVREGKAVAALLMLGGHQFTTGGAWKDLEVISPGAQNGAVCEVGLLKDFGGFDAFKRAIAASNVHFDREKMTLIYKSNQSGEITINTRGRREVDGCAVNLDYPAYGSPYMQSDWDSGVITLTHRNQKETLDFRARR